MATKSELIEKVEILEKLLAVSMEHHNQSKNDVDIIWQNVLKIVDDNWEHFLDADDGEDMFRGFREQVLDFEVEYKLTGFSLIDAYEIIAFLVIWIEKKYINL